MEAIKSPDRQHEAIDFFRDEYVCPCPSPPALSRPKCHPWCPKRHLTSTHAHAHRPLPREWHRELTQNASDRFTLDYELSQLSKPYVVIMDGITSTSFVKPFNPRSICAQILMMTDYVDLFTIFNLLPLLIGPSDPQWVVALDSPYRPRFGWPLNGRSSPCLKLQLDTLRM